MKDLYARLQVSPLASREEIAKAIPRASALTRSDAEAVLMQPGRKAVYDRTHQLLVRLAAVRGALDLQEAPYGSSPLYVEYRPARKSAPPSWAPPSSGRQGMGAPEWPSRSEARRREGSRVVSIVVGLAALGTLVLVLVIGSREDGLPSQAGLSTPEPATALVVAPAGSGFKSLIDAMEQPAPKPALLPAGIPPRCSSWVQPSNWRNDFAINVRTKSNSDYTLVRIYRAGAEHHIAEQFIYPGTRCELALPFGRYTMRTASGDTWYGDEHIFGPHTRYSEANAVFELTEPGAYYEVELIPQVGGNMPTRSISAAQF